MTPREVEEYRALRETIRERGTSRVWFMLAGLSAWAGLVVSTIAWAPFPMASLIPLLVLGACFEGVFAFHTGVERIGRYLQVFYEDDDSPRRWESQAMAYGSRFPGGAVDPLFVAFFGLATFLNFVPVVLAMPVAIEYVVVGAFHVLLLARLAFARRHAIGQRPLELERFRQLRNL